jgi:hypothetical protein
VTASGRCNTTTSSNQNWQAVQAGIPSAHQPPAEALNHHRLDAISPE